MSPATRCDTQMRVSLVEHGGIEARDLLPACQDCHRATGRPVIIRQPSLDALATLGHLDEDCCIIGEMNNRDA